MLGSMESKIFVHGLNLLDWNEKVDKMATVFALLCASSL